MTNENPIARQIASLLAQKPGMTSGQLQGVFELSSSAVSRHLQSLGSQLLRVKSTTGAGYALSECIPGLGACWPIRQVCGSVRGRCIGRLYAVHGGFYFEPERGCPAELNKPLLVPGLPWFLADSIPTGWMAPQVWGDAGFGHYRGMPNDREALAYLVRAGQSLPGALVVGDEAWDVVQASFRGGSACSTGWAAGAWEKRVEAVPGGEVIVKVARTAIDAALLRCEWHAAQVLAGLGLDVASSELRERGDALELRVSRFDRRPDGFRVPVYSLASLDAEFTGMGTGPWPEAVRGLCSSPRFSQRAVSGAELAWMFGRMTGNADMHFGNLSFVAGSRGPLELAPLYDMLPMALRGDPSAGMPWVLREIKKTREVLGDGHSVVRAAAEFWKRVASDESMAPAVKEAASRALAELT